jgi:hypothetical protein
VAKPAIRFGAAGFRKKAVFEDILRKFTAVSFVFKPG